MHAWFVELSQVVALCPALDHTNANGEDLQARLLGSVAQLKQHEAAAQRRQYQPSSVHPK
jgi:hypothetical protein